MSFADLLALIGCAPKTLRRMVRDGSLPPPLPLGRGKHWWNREQVEKALGMRSS
jgi:predicted DNA-binding transcriptional regulator AlpA